MLSRVAEQMYWLGRYVERAENTARLVNVSTGMTLDLPREAPPLWQVLMRILGIEASPGGEERQVVRLLLADETNPSSVLASLARARENARTSREILPSEAWEWINNAYWRTRDEATRSIARNPRQEFLQRTIAECQLFAGVLAGTMSHNAAYRFVEIGRHLERADMTTRVLDLGAATDGWMGVLFALSAYQMYHQHIGGVVQGPEVVRFLLLNPDFPRTVGHCLNSMAALLQCLPRHEDPLRAVRDLQAPLAGIDIDSVLRAGLDRILDEMQAGLSEIHYRIEACWFSAAG
jgi:uncharacterized alpha-E superfamily protein